MIPLFRRAWFCAFIAGLSLTACATDPARLPLIDPGDASGQRHAIHVVTSRTPAALEEDRFGPGRAETLSFALAEVWVPHDRLPGRIEHPGRRPDPQHEFALADWEDLPTAADFTRSLDARLEAIAFPEREVFLFVHGFNTPFSDGLYLNAQILNDFGVLNAAVHYSWPSAGQIPAYLYDRDSALFARDGLVETLTLLSQRESRSIILLAHSMGSLVTMEALRQLSQTGRHDVLDHIDTVVLASPDIDLDVFRAQFESLSQPPEHFVIFTSQRDLALRLSDQLRGGRRTLLGIGAQQDVLEEMGITVIDLTELTDGGFTNHTAFAASPTLQRMAQTGVLSQAILGEGSEPR